MNSTPLIERRSLEPRDNSFAGTIDDAQLVAIVDQVVTARLGAELNLTEQTETRADADGEEE